MGDDVLGVRDLAILLWKQKRLIIVMTFGLGLLAGGVSATQHNTYTATVVLSPVPNPTAAGRLAGQASQVGGLASLIGLSFGGDTSKAESLAVLQSVSLTEGFIRDNNLLPLLFKDKWDAASRQWKVGPAERPTLWKASEAFAKIRNVAEDKKLSLTTLTITWTDPVTAAKWANDLVKAANQALRNQAIEESQQHIVYLNNEANQTDVAQIRAAIYAVLESEIKNVMLAKGPGDYALKVIDPAIPPEKRSGPQPLLWAIGGASLGLVLAVFVILLRRAWQEDPAT